MHNLKEPTMVAIQQDTTVQPGGIIHIHSDQLPDGARAQVIILLNEPPAASRTLSSFLGAGKGSVKSAAEIDAFLSAERDSWER